MSPQSDRFIRLPEVQRRVAMGKTKIYAEIKAGRFPKPVKLGFASGWVEGEIAAWIEERKQARCAA